MSNTNIFDYNNRGTAYFTCSQAVVTTTALSTTATGCILYNPWGSGKKLVILDARWIYTAAITAVSGVMLSMGNTPSVAATPAGTAQSIWRADGSGVTTTQVARAFTIATTNVVNVYVAPLAHSGTALVSAYGEGFHDGKMLVVPGNYVMFSHVTTAVVGIGSFLWAEIDE